VVGFILFLIVRQLAKYRPPPPPVVEAPPTK
jgi:hypothetical protein